MKDIIRELVKAGRRDLARDLAVAAKPLAPDLRKLLDEAMKGTPDAYGISKRATDFAKKAYRLDVSDEDVASFEKYTDALLDILAKEAVRVKRDRWRGDTFAANAVNAAMMLAILGGIQRR